MNTEYSNLELNSEATASVESTEIVYEAPAIESVLTSETLEREVHYAGVQPVSGAVAA